MWRAPFDEQPAGPSDGVVAPCPVTVRALEADYGSSPVLQGIDLDVAAGEIMALLGPSGCGKTTLLRCLAGLEPTTAGTITLGDRVVNQTRPVPPERRPVGMVFQDGALFPHLSVVDNVRYGMPRRTRRGEAARDLLRLVGLDDKAYRMPGTLSGGEQQRVALARALARRPGVLLLDEPFSSLDAALRVQLRGEVHTLLKSLGVTAVFVTHDQQEALMFGDRVAVMRAGRLEQIGPPTEVYGRPATPWVARFVGEANLLPGHSSGTTADTALGSIATDATSAGPVVVLARPEQLALDVGGPDRILEITYLGADHRSQVLLASGAIVTVRAAGEPVHGEGAAVTVRWTGATAPAWPATALAAVDGDAGLGPDGDAHGADDADRDARGAHDAVRPADGRDVVEPVAVSSILGSS
jgi:iron(III) transport system ATP-binding protein